MPILNTGALRRACRAQANDNGGFIYVEDALDDVRERYENDDDVGRVQALFTSRITESRLADTLGSLTDGDAWSEVRRGSVYFHDPFKSANGNVEEIDRILSQVFSAEPYVRKKDLRSKLSRSGINVAEEDIDFFIDKVADRGRIEQRGYGPADYQKAGYNLLEETKIQPIPELLADEAEQGTITKSAMERALSMQINDDIMRDLRQSDHIHQLEDHYLVNLPECIERFADSLIDQDFSRDVERAFTEQDGVMSESTFREVLREKVNERTNALRAVGEPQEFLSHVASRVEHRFDLDEVEADGTETYAPTTLTVHESVADRVVGERAAAIEDDVESETESWGTLSETRELDVRPRVENLDLGPRHEAGRAHLRDRIENRAVDRLVESESNPLVRPEDLE